MRGAAGALLCIAAATATGCTPAPVATTDLPTGAGVPGAPPFHAVMRIEVRRSALGPHLTDASGRSLYVMLSGTGRCVGTCRVIWPPVLVQGAVRTGPGLDAAGVQTTDTGDGQRQLTFRGQPLFYYVGDRGADEIRGYGCTSFGTTWLLVAPSGTPIRAAPAGWRPG